MAMATTDSGRSRLSMSAVFGGVFTALVVQILLVMLGLGVGVIAIDVPSMSQSSATGLSWATFGWWAVSGIVASFIGGLVAGWGLSDNANARGVHGLVAWAIATIVVVGASALAAERTVSIASNLAGPIVTQTARLGDLTRQMAQGGGAGATTGAAQSTAEQNRPQIQAAQNALASAMLGSFVALVLGAIAAFFGARLAPEGPAYAYSTGYEDAATGSGTRVFPR